MPITFLTYLSRYLWAVRPSPQNSAQAKVRWGPAARKSPIDEGFYSVGMNKAPPLNKVSLYSVSKTLQNKNRY